jgi:cold shock CspA family protein
MRARGTGGVPPIAAAGAAREGTVTAFDSKRGLGEIKGADGRAYPFHCTRIADGTREIPVGAAVEFRVAPGPLGRWEAVEIRRRS